MLRRKNHTKRTIKRVQKRRSRTLISFFLFTFFLSGIAIALSFLFAPHMAVLSPTPVLSAKDTTTVLPLIETELKKQNVTAKTIEQNDDLITVTLTTNQVLLLSKKRDIKRDLASLQLIMRQLTMEGKRFTRLDLRFDKPVITTN